MLPRFVFVLVAMLCLLFVGMIGGAMERRGWPHGVITAVVGVLYALIAYGIITIGPTL